MRLSILSVGLILLFSGCICCGGADLSGITSKLGGEGKSDGGCSPPYIAFGTGCCLDYNANSICDSDETTQETQPTRTWQDDAAEGTTTTRNVQTTAADITLKPTTTTAPSMKAKTYECVRASGYDPDSVIYFYSTRCGDDYVTTAEMVSVKKGVDFTKVKIGGLQSEKLNALMTCFYGGQSPEWSICPRLLCPSTGKVQTLEGRGTATVRSQMEGFALKCG